MPVIKKTKNDIIAVNGFPTMKQPSVKFVTPILHTRPPIHVQVINDWYIRFCVVLEILSSLFNDQELR
jgi:hypothetical protein